MQIDLNFKSFPFNNYLDIATPGPIYVGYICSYLRTVVVQESIHCSRFLPISSEDNKAGMVGTSANLKKSGVFADLLTG